MKRPLTSVFRVDPVGTEKACFPDQMVPYIAPDLRGIIFP